MDFTTINALASSAARGCYQHALLTGSEPWSGAGLQGKANTWSSGYARSREGLLARLNVACESEGATFTTALVMDEKVMRLKRRLVVTVDGVDFDYVREVRLDVDEKRRPVLPLKRAA
jgi:hypothetical protein